MNSLEYSRAIEINLKGHPELDERWVSERIQEDPSILGLGDLILKDVERIQPKAGRLDLLLVDSDDRRYEVELMLGGVDESHIIRTIEYWDIERKRYPQYDHCAVLVAEHVTGRFLNVISLFNSAIPIIAIQMKALQVGNNLVLHFARVLDEVERGEEEEDIEGASADRKYWEQKGSKLSLTIADSCVEILQNIDSSISLTYKKPYVGLSTGGISTNFVIFRPKKKFLNVEARTADRDEWVKKIEDAGLTVLEGGSQRRVKRARFQLSAEEVEKHRELLRELFQDAYKRHHGN